MPYKPFIPKKRCSMEKYRESIDFILNSFDLKKTMIYPGHGVPFLLESWQKSI